MRGVILCALLVGCTLADYDDQQQEQQSIKSIKGGQNWEHYNPSSADLVRIFESQNSHGQGQGYNMRTHLTSAESNIDVGVCYIEVPTASLVRGDNPVPAGNGSQPSLSRIRACCKGYIRNIHNFRKCDPVCTQECVNALCSAPETCTCFPDHIKNLGGFCIPTCPIGCQNGKCAGGECLCNEGFKLDSDSKFCLPRCTENCGGVGNCTAPNKCECKTGYQSTPTGSCQPVCEKCTNGDCIAPNDCRCHQGYTKNQLGNCELHCGAGFQPTPEGCKPVCNRCTNGDCVGPNLCQCHEGYAMDTRGICAPKCVPDCGPNRRCVGPNVCDPPIPPQTQPQTPSNISPYQRTNEPNNPLYPDSQYVKPLPSNVPQCLEPCLNGVCAGNNQCICNPGYTPSPTDRNRCLPSCPSGCPNGICSAPNFCICNAGYIKDRSVKGPAVCVKRVKRSANLMKSSDVEENNHPKNVAELLIFEIPDY